MKFYFAYLDLIVPDREAVRKLKENNKMIGEIIDMIVTDCGATDITVESIIAKY